MMITVMALYMTLKDFNSVNIVGVLRGGGDVAGGHPHRYRSPVDLRHPLCRHLRPGAAAARVLGVSGFPLEQIIKCSIGIARLRSGKWIRDVTGVKTME